MRSPKGNTVCDVRRFLMRRNERKESFFIRIKQVLKVDVRGTEIVDARCVRKMSTFSRAMVQFLFSGAPGRVCRSTWIFSVKFHQQGSFHVGLRQMRAVGGANAARTDYQTN